MPAAQAIRAEPAEGSTLFRIGLGVFLAALSLRLLFGRLVGDTYDYDEFVLLLLARDFAHGAVPYRDFMFFHPPGVLVILSVLHPLVSLWWPIARKRGPDADFAASELSVCRRILLAATH